MSSNDPLKNASDGIHIIGEIIKAAGDNPNVKEAGNELGKTALILTKAINNALLPLAAVNFAFEKARAYFSTKFQHELENKASAIPPEQIIEPKASVAGPALQGLAFSHEEPDLKEMYLSLLASAMDGRIAQKAHPAFVEVIRQLTSVEAQLLHYILRSPTAIAIVEVQLVDVGPRSYKILLRHLLNLLDASTAQPSENPQLTAMVDNWIRLGLIQVDYEKYLSDDNQYSWVETRPEVIRFRTDRETEKEKVELQRGILNRTAFGEQFASVVGLLN